MKALALDLGASGGRVLCGIFDGKTLRVEEVHRFDNEAVQSGGHLHWDIDRIRSGLLEGMRKAAREGFSSFGVDSFCNDYALLDEAGNPLAPVHAYRDKRTEGVLEQMDQRMPAHELYERTGNQRARFNTLVQLTAHLRDDPDALKKARSLLFVPDLLDFYLCGERAAEFTIASVSQLYNCLERGWDCAILHAFDVPEGILPSIVPTACRLGRAGLQVLEQTAAAPFWVCTVGHHDTASAVAAVPSAEPHFAYISSGTWSLMGTVSDATIRTDSAFRLNFANEGAADGRNRFLKNIMGLWLLQEVRRQLGAKGHAPTFGELDAKAEAAAPFRTLIDPDDPRLFEPGDMIGRLQAQCRERGEPVPVSEGELTRCIQESLALAYRFTLQQLEELTGLAFPCVHMIGGGARSALLNRFAAGSVQRPVLAGPYEATAIGNLLAQCIAMGQIASWVEARQVVRASFGVTEFAPENKPAWDDAYGRFVAIKSPDRDAVEAKARE